GGLRGQPGRTGAAFALRRAPEDGRTGRTVDPTLAFLRSLACLVSASGFRTRLACLLAAAADAGALRRQSCPAHAEGHGANQCQIDKAFRIATPIDKAFRIATPMLKASWT